MKIKSAKLSRINLKAFALFFCIFKPDFLPVILQQSFKILFIGLILLDSFYYIKAGKEKEGIVLATVYILASFVGLINGFVINKTFFDGVLQGLCVLSLFLFIKKSRYTGKYNEVINNFWLFSLMSSVISIISVLYISCIGTFDERIMYHYGFGNKFQTSYMFILFEGLTYHKWFNEKTNKFKRHWDFIGIILILTVFTRLIDCNTGVIGQIFFLLMTLLMVKKNMKNSTVQDFISRPVFAVIYLLIPGLVAVNIAIFLQNSFIRNLLIKYFNETGGLNGRVYIFSIIADFIQSHPILGYGYNSFVIERYSEVGNAQNGVFDILVKYGIVGLVALIFVVYSAFKASENKKQFLGLKMVFIIMCICGIAEVSYNFQMLTALFFLRFSEMTVKLQEKRSIMYT